MNQNYTQVLIDEFNCNSWGEKSSTYLSKSLKKSIFFLWTAKYEYGNISTAAMSLTSSWDTKTKKNHLNLYYYYCPFTFLLSFYHNFVLVPLYDNQELIIILQSYDTELYNFFSLFILFYFSFFIFKWKVPQPLVLSSFSTALAWNIQ